MIRIKNNCMGCVALAKQSDKFSDGWRSGCALGYENPVTDIGMCLPVPVPKTICPKPYTYKKLRLLQEQVNNADDYNHKVAKIFAHPTNKYVENPARWLRGEIHCYDCENLNQANHHCAAKRQNNAGGTDLEAAR